MKNRYKNGEMIGNYRIAGFLGSGGMGEVYKGVHIQIERTAAIKVMYGKEFSDGTFKARFSNEARLQAKLHHPNIATLYDFKQEDDRLFIFMELIEGDCLDEIIKSRGMTVEESLKIVKSILEAVGYIHRYGIVHRDVKAQNIRVTSAGVAKLLDFGISKDAASEELTKTGGVVGTPNHLAPEIYTGAKASPQSDIWAVGILLYRMLTGRVPFTGDTLGNLVSSILSAKFDPPENLNPAVDDKVSRIVKKCLSKNLRIRYQNAEQVIEDIDTILKNKYDVSITRAEVTDTRIQPVSKPPKQPLTRAGYLVSIIGALLIALVFCFGIFMWIMSGEKQLSPNKTKDSSMKKDSGDPDNTSIGKINRESEADKKPEKSVSVESVKQAKLNIKIDVVGGKADVIRDGKIFGKTPLEIKANEGETIDLILRRQGFRDENVRIEATSGKNVYTFILQAE